MTDPVLSIRALTLRRGEREVLAGFDLVVGRGEIVALMAPSGAGKTTVLRAAAGLMPFDGGEVLVGGVTLPPGRLPSGATLRALRRQVGMVFQQHFLFEHLTALENVTLAPVRVLGARRAEAEERAMRLLAALGVEGRARALPRELSGGEAQRVAIARSLAMDPPLLLMDEPTASLDPARRGELGRTLSTLREEGRTLLVTTHDTGFAAGWATRVAVLDDGAVVEEGEPALVLTRPQSPATRRLLAAGDLGNGRNRSDANLPKEQG
ncbi:MAG: amino acid ABC transporter ATP-binding protein [Acidithiobacillales bacterium]